MAWRIQSLFHQQRKYKDQSKSAELVYHSSPVTDGILDRYEASQDVLTICAPLLSDYTGVVQLSG